jgi:hypothetical protein
MIFGSAARGDGADLLAPLGGLGETALLRRRKLRQRVQLGAVVKTSASEIGERLGGDLLATGDIAGDSTTGLTDLLCSGLGVSLCRNLGHFVRGFSGSATGFPFLCFGVQLEIDTTACAWRGGRRARTASDRLSPNFRRSQQAGLG